MQHLGIEPLLKPFVMLSSVIMGLGLLILALVHIWLAVIVATILQGIGFGAYITVDLALITQVLPRAETRGQDLGVMVIALNIAQFIAPAVGTLIVSLFAANIVAGYSALYMVAALLTLLSTVLVLPIKSVRRPGNELFKSIIKKAGSPLQGLPAFR